MSLQRSLRRLSLIVVIGVLAACGSDSANSGVTAFGTAYKSFTAAMGNAAILKSTPSSRASSERTGLAGQWTGTNYMNDPRCSGGASDPHCSTGNITLKDYMGISIGERSVRDNNSSISIFGRIKNSMMIACAVMTVTAGGTGAYPANGTYTITLDAATKTIITNNCDVGAGDLSEAPASVSITISDATGGVYDKKFAMNLSSRATQDFYLSYTAGGALRIGNIEHNTNGSSRTLINYDFATKSGRAQYTSAKPGCVSNCYGENTRLFWDETNDRAAMLSVVGQTGGQMMYYYLAGQPKTSGTNIGVSIFQSGYSMNAAGNACVNPNTGAIASDDPSPVNSSSCSAAGLVDMTTGAPKTNADAFFNTGSANNLTAAYWGTDSPMTTTTTVPFTTITDIATVSHNQ